MSSTLVDQVYQKQPSIHPNLIRMVTNQLLKSEIPIDSDHHHQLFKLANREFCFLSHRCLHRIINELQDLHEKIQN